MEAEILDLFLVVSIVAVGLWLSVVGDADRRKF